MNRRFKFSPGEFYHIYNRGVDKRQIYMDESDYERFCKLLYIANNTEPFEMAELEQENFYSIKRRQQLVDVCAYCLMPNHFHLILREKSDSGVSIFMKKLQTGYAMYFNALNERSGALFQGKFKAKHISTDQYLRHAPLYVHMNSLDTMEPKWRERGLSSIEKAEKYMKSYPYSSFMDTTGTKRDMTLILSTGSLPGYYDSFEDQLTDLRDWLQISQGIGDF